MGGGFREKLRRQRREAGESEQAGMPGWLRSKLGTSESQRAATIGSPGTPGDPGLPQDLVEVSERMVNDTRWPHAMHFHGHHVQVQAKTRHDRPGTWRDTALLDRGEQMEVAFVADNPGRWMLHCHMLEHQMAGMATWFEVT